MFTRLFLLSQQFIAAIKKEQIEEERTARVLNDKLELIGDDRSGVYLFDRDIMNYRGPGPGGKK